MNNNQKFVALAVWAPQELLRDSAALVSQMIENNI